MNKSDMTNKQAAIFNAEASKSKNKHKGSWAVMRLSIQFSISANTNLIYWENHEHGAVLAYDNGTVCLASRGKIEVIAA